MTSDNPEQQPANLRSFDNFKANLNNGQELKTSIDKEHEALETQLSEIIRDVVIDDMPIMMPIMKFANGSDDLRKIAEACLKAAPIMDQLDVIHDQLTVLDVAQRDPTFMLAAFGDFKDEFADFDPDNFAQTPPAMLEASPTIAPTPKKKYQDI